MRMMIMPLLACSLTGCSVGMALSGSKEPDLGAVTVGASRGQVELHMGSPISTKTLEDGRRTDVYQYEIGNAPSTGRAVGHAAMDVLTLGLWEIIGTPIEAIQGEIHHLTVIYDENDRVGEMRSSRVQSSAF